jgi:hypothetical protein
MNIKYTKINKLYEQNNDMCHNFYYIYHGRIYNEDNTKYRKFKYIEWFDIFDLQEYYEKAYITEEEIRNFALNLENGYLLNIRDYNDTENLEEFYKYCNETIRNYIEIVD